MRNSVTAAIFGLLLGTGQATASPLIWSSVLGGAAGGALRENFDSLDIGAATQVTPTGIAVQLSGTARVVVGSLSGRYAAPFLTGANGAGFGDGGGDQAGGANLTTYLSTGSSGADSSSQVTLILPFKVDHVGLLWGSVDAYNSLSLYDGAMLIGTLTGAQIATPSNGNQGPDGTRYVNIESAASFDRLVFTSTQYAFEFDNLAIRSSLTSALALVPAPGPTAILAAGLLALAALRRRRAAA
ncbi:MAG TPA: hypothetical protein VGN83_07050 [Falsiroseomonas sp.]|jgi:hypothetical protein|nr:hypothetical protein [Falsiroseomonas sp.]